VRFAEFLDPTENGIGTDQAQVRFLRSYDGAAVTWVEAHFVRAIPATDGPLQ